MDGLGEQVLQRHKFPVKIKVVGVQPSQNARCRVWVFFSRWNCFPFENFRNGLDLSSGNVSCNF